MTTATTSIIITAPRVATASQQREICDLAQAVFDAHVRNSTWTCDADITISVHGPQSVSTWTVGTCVVVDGAEEIGRDSGLEGLLVDAITEAMAAWDVEHAGGCRAE